jgi:mono/diheme cytochrome c family protein
VTRTWLALGMALAGALTIHAAGRTVWDGVYTDAQAERGTEVYAEHCSRCHGDFLDGAGAGERVVALAGVTFEDDWESASLSDLFDKIARTMPRDAPGTVTRRQVLDLVAFLLRSNGYPSGASELTDSAELALVDIVGRNGPRPLRAGAGVRSVGCLAKDAGDLWTLVRASVPVRTRNPLASSERDLDRARAAPLGEDTITLTGPAPGRASGPGMQVEVKGVLSAIDPPRYRITVMSLQPIAPACP